jgi:serine/threonine protein kinase/Tfp pilus assembly protein PilF
MSDHEPDTPGEVPTSPDPGGSDTARGTDAGERNPVAPRRDEPPPPLLKRLGDFDILREIGRGGMGVVYEARQVSLKRRVALKVLPPAMGLTQQARQRFEREAQAAAKLHHTNIVPVHAIGEDDAHHFYAMDLIEGQSLDRVLHQLVDEGSSALLAETVTRAASELPKQLLSPAGSKRATTGAKDSTTSLGDTSVGSRPWFDALAKLIAEVADALDYAHGRGVIHRDIKPANLMLSSDGKLCITDFGLARIVQEPGMTVSGSLLGTPAYMSPEQIAAGRVKLDHRTDVYSLGAVLYELLTLQRPFVGESREEVLSAIMAKDPRSPRKLNGRIPQDLETICFKAMEKDPDRRYRTAGELANDLRQHVQGGLITARRAGVLRRSSKTIRRHPTAAVFLVAVAVASAIGLLAWRALSGKAEADVGLLVSEARLMMERGEYRPGLDKAERALALDPANHQARLVRARMLLQRVHWPEAADEARRVLRDDPDNWEAHLVLAVAAKYVPTIDAQAHLAAVEGRVPDTADAFYLRGLVAESSREALQWFDRALELNPAHARALFARGDSLLRLGDLSAAMANAERLVAVRSRSAQGRRTIGSLFNIMHEEDRAHEAYDRAIELDPEDAVTWAQRGANRALDRGEEDEGLEDLTRAIELDPDLAFAHGIRAVLYNNRGEYENAIEGCRRALELEPDWAATYGSLAWAYWQNGQKDKALAALEELNSRSASWHDKNALLDARRQIANFHRRLGNHERVLDEAEKMIELRPDWLDGYRMRAGARRELEGDSAIGEDCDLMAGLKFEEPEPGPFRRRGNLMRDFCRRMDQALADYGRAIELAPFWADPYYERALLHETHGDPASALAYMEKAVELAPSWTDAIDNLGRLRDSNR